ncbi:hypothetical protein DUNSADRAFT_17552 [Dunaliella salina]|nr:hypothetical protein DUNSADRAFT_17552 [Dunaliella salina]|eukprot:KAF5828492.1 hypothetical protein DUNSADRAFT_17552 [Dunaliella salina]
MDGLTSLNDWLHTLEMPCKACPVDTILFLTRHTSKLQYLVLHLSVGPDPEQSMIPGSWRLSQQDAMLANSQLHTVVLSVPVGSVPHKIDGSHLTTSRAPNDYSMNLYLSCFPSLQHLVLRGPIVKVVSHDYEYDQGYSLFLQPHVKVTIDPGLGGRQATPWARNVVDYVRFDKMPRQVLPHDWEYKEEDLAAREARINSFVDAVCMQAKERYGPESDVIDYLRFGFEDLHSTRVSEEWRVPWTQNLMRLWRSDDLLKINVKDFLQYRSVQDDLRDILYVLQELSLQ